MKSNTATSKVHAKPASETLTLMGPKSDFSPTLADIHLVSVGKAAMRAFLGSDEQQRSLFSAGVSWDRLFLLRSGESPVGYLSFCVNGKGAYHVQLRQFRALYGRGAGFFRWLAYRMFMRFTASKYIYIQRVYIRPEWREQGLGKLLVARAVAEFHQAYGQVVELDVYAKNHRAIRLYQSLGFEVIKKRSFLLLGNKMPDSCILRMRLLKN